MIRVGPDTQRDNENTARPQHMVPLPVPTLPLLLSLCRFHTALIPGGGAIGSACDAYVWRHATIPPDSEMAHIIRMARASVERRVFLLIACCHEETLNAIKAAVLEAVPVSGKVVLQ